MESYGYDSRVVFHQVGLDADKLYDPNARYSYSKMVRLWDLAIGKTKDPCLGLKVAQFWHPTTVHALGYSWLASSCLKDAFMRASRYGRILNTSVRLRLTETSSSYYFIIDDSRLSPPLRDETMDATLAIFMIMCRVSYGSDVAPRRVLMRRTSPQCSNEFVRFFRAPITFAASTNGFVFDRELLNTRLPTANERLALANDKIVMEYLTDLDQTDIAMRVKNTIIDKLSSGEFGEETIADAFSTSLRSLQRKLHDAGTSYKQLLDETRRELAEQYIQNSQLKVNEITFLLGFSEPSSFSRAFKRWKGISPTSYRQVN